MKITAERLAWLKKNKRDGDILAVFKKLNPKNKKNGLKYSTTRGIISGHMWGNWGEVVTNALEEHINDRNTKEALEKEKYTSLSNNETA